MTRGRMSYHTPTGNPCRQCGKSHSYHRVSHKSVGDPCTKCNLMAYQHKDGGSSKKTDSERIRYFGIDGEGIGRKNHRYIMLAARSENGLDKRFLEVNPKDDKARIRTTQFLDFILGLAGKHIKVFSYAFNYDLTKGLTDLDNESLYFLFRPNLRHRAPKYAHLGPRPIKWKGYKLNLQGTKFTVSKAGRKVVVWDLFKFFQSKFVGALRSWGIGSDELLTRMSAKKDERAEFDRLYSTDDGRKSIENYCMEECQCMAQLVHKLVKAHEDAEIPLRTFYGAGSSSTAMLSKMGVKDRIVPINPLMKHAVACGFVGGRFEHSAIGSIRRKLFNKDISAAYPYHMTFLPCLEHGTWVLSSKRKDIEKSQAALVRYKLGKPSPRDYRGNWGPFPFRTKDGTVTFPITSGGGWVWKEEYLAGERIFDHVEFVEAWVYQTRCDCKPFSQVPEFYLMRLKLGKESAGNAIKLAINGGYGKLAQSVGRAVFNQWIWAGIITSGCRAQGLDVLGLHKDRRNLYMIATDGLLSAEDIKCPKPIMTGTGGLFPCGCKKECEHENKVVSKPLGGWENKTMPDGIFLARPGIYFPLNPTEDDIKDIKGRGLGKGIILKNWERIVDHWEKKGITEKLEVANVPRFCGAKTSISKSKNGYRRASHTDGIKPAYGQWVQRKIEMSFNPLPKRAGIHKDGVSLILIEYPKDLESMPYKKAVRSPEALELAALEEMMLEQPDPDFRNWGADGAPLP